MPSSSAQGSGLSSPSARAMSFARAVLLLCALPFIAIGLAFLVQPALLGSFVDVDVVSALADNDVRAVYGGLQLACGVVLALCSRWDRLLAPGLFCLLILYGGLAAGRSLSWLLAGSPGALGLVLHGGELIAIVSGIAALRVLHKGVSATQLSSST